MHNKSIFGINRKVKNYKLVFLTTLIVFLISFIPNVKAYVTFSYDALYDKMFSNDTSIDYVRTGYTFDLDYSQTVRYEFALGHHSSYYNDTVPVMATQNFSITMDKSNFYMSTYINDVRDSFTLFPRPTTEPYETDNANWHRYVVLIETTAGSDQATITISGVGENATSATATFTITESELDVGYRSVSCNHYHASDFISLTITINDDSNTVIDSLPVARTSFNLNYPYHLRSFYGWDSVSTAGDFNLVDEVNLSENKTIYARFGYLTPTRPVVSSPNQSEEYHSSNEPYIVCNVEDAAYTTNKPSTETLYYEVGYSETADGTPGHWEPAGNTWGHYDVPTDEYIGERWYWCRAYTVYSENPGYKTPYSDVSTSSTKVTITNTKISFYAIQSTIAGTDASSLTLYSKYGTPYLYTGNLNTEVTSVPGVTERLGYTFLGWYTSSDGANSTKVINADGTVITNVDGWTDSEGNFLRTEDSNLYTVFEPNIYTLTLDYQGGTIPGGNGSGSDTYYYIYKQTSPCKYYTDSTLTTCVATQPMAVPTREHYILKGFYTAPNGGGTKYLSFDGYISGYEVYTRTPSQINSNYTDNAILYAYWEPEAINVTKPDGSVVVKHYGDSYDLGANTVQKSSVNGAMVRFYINGASYAGYSVTKAYTPNGWFVNDVPYADNTVITITEPIVITRNYTETKVSPTFPSPTRDHYTFDGWYDAEENGDPITSYTGDEEIRVYGFWIGDPVNLILPDDTVVAYHYGDTYTLGTNDVPKANENGASITFRYRDDVTPNTVDYVIRTYTPAGWYVNGTYKNDGATITLTAENTELEYRYTGSNVSPVFPTPTREHYTFDGWYRYSNSKYESYTGESDIELYAVWIGDPISVTYADGSVAIRNYGDTYNLGSNWQYKSNETVSTVTFHYGYNDMTSEGYVERSFDYNGWLVNGVEYPNSTVITITEPIVIEYNYTPSIVPCNFSEYSRSGYRFLGWYDDPEAGNLMTSYSGTEDIDVYAHWQQTAQVRIYDGSSAQTVDVGTTITLPQDDNGYNNSSDNFWFDFDYNWPDGYEEIEYNAITVNSVFDHWRINDQSYEPGSEYTVTGDTYVYGEYRKEIDQSTIPTLSEWEDYVPVGGWWTTADDDGKIFDFEVLTTEDAWNTYYDMDRVLYAHWVEFDPETQVLVNWDNDYQAYDIGTVIDLDRERKKTYEEHTANVYLDMRNILYEDQNTTLEVKTRYTREAYLINGEEHSATGSYTLTENTTIESIYADEVLYPTLPSYNYTGFLGFYDTSDNWISGNENRVTSLEDFFDGNITDVDLYAHWYAEYVNVYVDGELWTDSQEKGTDSLYSGDSKVKYLGVYFHHGDYEVVDNQFNDFHPRSLYYLYYYPDYLMINGVRYELGEDYDYQADTYIETVYRLELHEDWQNSFRWGSTMFCMGVTSSQCAHVALPGDAYIDGWYTGENGTGRRADLERLYVQSPEETFGDDVNDYMYSSNDPYPEDDEVIQLYAHWVTLPQTVNVTVDEEEPFTKDVGHSDYLIPQDMELDLEKDDDTFTITFDYNDGSNTTVARTATRHYYFTYFTIDGAGSYSRNDDYYFYKDVHIESNYNIDSIDYPEVPEVDNPKFKGWYTKPSGGNYIDNYELQYSDIEENTTLYAQYYTGTATVNFDGEIFEVDRGTPITMEQKDSTTKYITINFDYNNSHYPTQEVHFTTVLENDYFEARTNNHGDFELYLDEIYIVEEDTLINTHYNAVENINDFEPYSPYEWDIGMIYYDQNEAQHVLNRWQSEIYYDPWCRDCGGEVGPKSAGKSNSSQKRKPSLDVGGEIGEGGNTGDLYDIDLWSLTADAEIYDGTTIYALWESDSVQVEYYDTIDDYWWNTSYYESGNEIDWIPDYQKTGYFFDGWYSNRVNWTGKLVPGTLATRDIVYYGRWIEDDRTDPDNETLIVKPNSTETVPKNSTYSLGTNNITKEDEEDAWVTFHYQDGETEDYYGAVMKVYTPNGWLVDDVHYDDGEEITCTEDVYFISPDYIVEYESPEFPTPTSVDDELSFKGWSEFPGGGNLVTEYTGLHDIDVFAQWGPTAPTDFDVDANELTLLVGGTHQIVPTFIPAGTEDTLVYSEYDNEVVSVVDGLITGIAPGTTTIKVELTSDNTIYKTISVTVLSNELLSGSLSVQTMPLGRIVIGEEPQTALEDFLSKINNPSEYIKVYDMNDELVEDTTEFAKTGMKIKLVINNEVIDEAYVVVRGDLDGDGYVDASDGIIHQNIILEKPEYDGYKLDYRAYAADLDYDPNETEEIIIDATDGNILDNKILEKIDSLNH